MGRYLKNLERDLRQGGFCLPASSSCCPAAASPLSRRRYAFPVRLVESGPAGGAIFASHIARQGGLDQVLSFDMGGTTAKICLIDAAKPQTSRVFEVARIYRFKKGSGLPLRIPVIEMVEIGAGGGSIRPRRCDGAASASAPTAPAPSPDRSANGAAAGTAPTVTDADLTLGRIDAAEFSGGKLPLDGRRPHRGRLRRRSAIPSISPSRLAATGISEMVDENMSNAAACPCDRERQGRARPAPLVAFGGAAPLHGRQGSPRSSALTAC